MHWIASHGRVYFEGEGENRRAVRFVGANREITKEKQTEEAIRASQRQNEFLASIVELSSQAFGVGYPDGSLGLVNKAFEQLTGYTGDELRAEPALNGTPVAILTTSESEEDICGCYTSGRCRYFVKTGDFRELVTIVRKIIEFAASVETADG